ncbi:glycerophosphodiester phosphodiesterase family protein [uncultured Blautia sp.]|nr:glycerophosphodiester phosphodiesterase family protein [uncultured Blautia sp.]
MLQLKQLDNQVQTGILFSDGWVNPAMYAKNLGINAVHPAVYHLKYPQFMEEVKRAGLKMHVWTANKPEHIQLVKDAGAEAVITNYPDRALEIVNS